MIDCRCPLYFLTFSFSLLVKLLFPEVKKDIQNIVLDTKIEEKGLINILKFNRSLNSTIIIEVKWSVITKHGNDNIIEKDIISLAVYIRLTQDKLTLLNELANKNNKMIFAKKNTSTNIMLGTLIYIPIQLN